MNLASRKIQKIADGTASDDGAAFHQIGDAIAAVLPVMAAAFSVPARAGSGTGVRTDVVSGTDAVFGRTGSGDLAFSQVSTGQIASAAITAAKLASTSVSANSYGDASHVAAFTVDAQGRLTAASSVAVAISAGAVSGLAAIATTGSADDLVAGTIPTARVPAFTGGDVTSAGASLVLTLAASGVSAGTVGDASHVATVTADAKGRVTALASTAIAINASAVASGNLANARLPVATTDAVLFGRSGGGYDSDSVIVIDPTNHRLGVNQASPAHTLDVTGDVHSTGDVAVGNQLTVADTAAFSGHVTATDGMAVSGGVLTATGSGGTAFAVVTGDADLQVNAHVGGDLTVDGQYIGIVPWSLPLVVDQGTTAIGGLGAMYLAPASADRQAVDRRFLFAGFGRSSKKQSFQAVMNSSQVSPGGSGYSVTWEIFVNGSASGLLITAPLTASPGSSTPTSFGTTGTLTIADGDQVAVKETSATTSGSPVTAQWNAYLMLVLH